MTTREALEMMQDLKLGDLGQVFRGDAGDTGEPGYTPKRGVDYFTKEDITWLIDQFINSVDWASLKGERGEKGEPGEDGDNGSAPIIPINEIVTLVLAALPPQTVVQGNSFTLTPETVKAIVKMMGQLPTNDRLDVTGIRNYQSFVFGGKNIKTKEYKIEELMHGGGSSTGGGVGAWSTPPETPNSIITAFTVGATAPTDVVADGVNLYEGEGYTYAASTVTFTNPPAEFVRYR
jgi:hypothetical protein